MLTRSPTAYPPSSNASPSFHAFHYAPGSSSSYHSSPSRLSIAAQQRRQSTPSIAGSGSALGSGSGSISASVGGSGSGVVSSPSVPPRPKRYVAVDAATQYSPMEPINYLATLHARQNLHKIPTELPPTPGPKPMTPGLEQGAQGPAPTGASTQPPAEAADVAAAAAATVPSRPVSASENPMSPAVKRRNSQAVASSSDDPATQSPTIQPKRARPDQGLPKVLPQRYELCPIEDVVVLIAHMLGELIETNDALALKSGHLTRFHSRTAPGISVLEYLHRLAKHATLSQPLLLSMVYYIDRLCAMYPDFTINTLTVHRFLITAATVAAKGLSDLFWNNTTYARVGGVRVAELKLLELEFLYRVDWKIVPNPEVLVAYYRGLVERCPGYVLQGEEAIEDGEEEEDDDDEDDIDDDDDDDDDEEEDDADDVVGAAENGR